MQKLKLFAFLENDSGAAAVEYALVAVLVAMAIILALGAIGTSLDDVFNSIAAALPLGGS